MGILIGLLLTVEVILSLLLILIILMQPSKADGGLGASFGGGATDSLFGARTGNVLTKATVWMTVILFVNSLLLGFLFSRQSSRVLSTTPTPPVVAQQATNGTPAAVTNTVPASATNAVPAAPKATNAPAPAAPAKK